MPEIGLNKIPIMGKTFWLQTGKKICVEIQKDANAGLMQDSKKNLHYRSDQYKKYKANRMERLTRTTKKGKRKSAFSIRRYYITESGQKVYVKGQSFGFRGKTYTKGGQTFGFLVNDPEVISETVSTGQKLKAYKGVAIVSNNTAFVDMTLTGKTLRGLKPKEAKDFSVILAFNPEDTQKVLGNRDNGYNLVGLNDKNIRIVKNEIVKKFEQNIKRDLLKTLKIEVRV